MGKTWRRNTGFKRDRRDKNFNRSRKFKEWEKPHKHHQAQFPPDDVVELTEEFENDESY